MGAANVAVPLLINTSLINALPSNPNKVIAFEPDEEMLTSTPSITKSLTFDVWCVFSPSVIPLFCWLLKSVSVIDSLLIVNGFVVVVLLPSTMKPCWPPLIVKPCKPMLSMVTGKLASASTLNTSEPVGLLITTSPPKPSMLTDLLNKIGACVRSPLIAAPSPTQYSPEATLMVAPSGASATAARMLS